MVFLSQSGINLSIQIMSIFTVLMFSADRCKEKCLNYPCLDTEIKKKKFITKAQITGNTLPHGKRLLLKQCHKRSKCFRDNREMIQMFYAPLLDFLIPLLSICVILFCVLPQHLTTVLPQNPTTKIYMLSRFILEKFKKNERFLNRIKIKLIATKTWCISYIS